MLQNKMKTEYIKKYLIALLWLSLGYVSWVIGVYLFSYGIAELVTPATKYLKTGAPQLLTLAHFVLFHIADFLLLGIVAFILSAILGGNRIWLIAFILWPVGYPVFATIRNLNFYLQYYPNGLPSWVTSNLIQSLIAYLIATPFFVWLGSYYGNKWHIKRIQA
jgi:hypothetical protein